MALSIFNKENLIQMVTSLFPGGANTTATILRRVFICMVQHPAVQGKGATARAWLAACAPDPCCEARACSPAQAPVPSLPGLQCGCESCSHHGGAGGVHGIGSDGEGCFWSHPAPDYVNLGKSFNPSEMV